MQIKIKLESIQMRINYQMKKSLEKKTKTHKHLVFVELIQFIGLIISLQDLKTKFVSENRLLNHKQ